MLVVMTKDKQQPFWTVVKRSIFGRCPNCGKGRLFASYLIQVEKCDYCKKSFGHIRADDGPAWLTVLIVAHLLAPFLFFVLSKERWLDWQVVMATIIYILTLVAIILPRAKGFFVGMIWRSGCIGSEK